MQNQLFDTPKKLACATLDFEQDYGWRVREFNILKENRPQIDALGDFFHELNVPVTAFITTHLLLDYPEIHALIRHLAADYHCHSHTHNTEQFDSRYEISTMKAVFTDAFGKEPLGYRAPLGVLRAGDVDLLAEYGFRFSSSVFPSFRPGQFNNLDMPAVPFRYPNGLVELPLAAVPKLHLIVALSYLKLLGYGVSNALYSAFGLPNVLIFNTHLHDFIYNETSFRKLPRKFQMIWGRNRRQGMPYFRAFVERLRRDGYQFVTMTELLDQIGG